MNLERLKKGDTVEFFNSIGKPEEGFDDLFKETLSVQERFRYDVLVFMKKNGYKLINSKCFKKKDVYIPVSTIEDFYKQNKRIDLERIINHRKPVKSM